MGWNRKEATDRIVSQKTTTRPGKRCRNCASELVVGSKGTEGREPSQCLHEGLESLRLPAWKSHSWESQFLSYRREKV